MCFPCWPWADIELKEDPRNKHVVKQEKDVLYHDPVSKTTVRLVGNTVSLNSFWFLFFGCISTSALRNWRCLPFRDIRFIESYLVASAADFLILVSWRLHRQLQLHQISRSKTSNVIEFISPPQIQHRLDFLHFLTIHSSSTTSTPTKQSHSSQWQQQENKASHPKFATHV
jgi:hypothetical protein